MIFAYACPKVVLIWMTVPFCLHADKFLSAPSTDIKQVERTLFSELAMNQSAGMIEWVIRVVEPTYRALPKDDSGGLDDDAVRYLLHRFFVQQHGWYIKGLEPSDTAPAPYFQSDWVPSYLHGLLEQRFGEHGMDLHEFAALAVTLEDLIGQEASRRARQLADIFDWHRMMSVDTFKNMMRAYLILFSLPPHVHAPLEPETLKAFVSRRLRRYPFAEVLLSLMDTAIENNATFTKDKFVDLEKSTGVFMELGLHYHKVNDLECFRVKEKLLSVETRPGRISLVDFYQSSDSVWFFEEKPEYLRSIGALDESIPNMSYVIIPNYITSKAQCYTATALYDVCCRDECEDLMQHVEKHVASPWAEIDQILNLIAALPSQTVIAPRELPPAMRDLLAGIAQQHGGKVPIHGRLFAQWMHHAYPHECSYPFPSATVNQSMTVTKDDLWSAREVNDFIKKSNTTLSTDGLTVHKGTCGPNGMCGMGGYALELPWSWTEELPLHDTVVLEASQVDSKLQAHGDHPKLTISNLTLIAMVALAVWFILLSEDAEAAIPACAEVSAIKRPPWADKAVKVLALLLFATFADTAIVVLTCLVGVLVLKVLPRFREQRPKQMVADKLSA